jgi:hypothetical protein
VRGEAYLALKRGPEAAKEFEKIVDHRGIVVSDPIGARAHLQLGRAFVSSGEETKAKTAYGEFLTLWKDADPDIPVLKQAQAEYRSSNNDVNASTVLANPRARISPGKSGSVYRCALVQVADKTATRSCGPRSMLDECLGDLAPTKSASNVISEQVAENLVFRTLCFSIALGVMESVGILIAGPAPP